MALYESYWKGLLQKLNAEQDFSSSFEKTFSDTGIESVGNRKSSGCKGYLELFAFNTRKKKNTQIFRDLEDVLKKYTGLRNKLGGQLDVRINKDNEVTFKYEPFSWELMMNRYRDSQDQTQMEHELYKWELVKEFQGIWRQYEDGQLTFVDLMGQVNWKNLVYHMFTPNFDYLISQKPEEVEQAFLKLYNEQAPLQGRIDAFRDTLESLHQKVKRKPKDVLFLNERETATILAFRYPDKYTLFMPTFYASLAKALGRKGASKWDQLVDYYEIVDDFRQNVLPEYEDIIAVKNSLTSDAKYYPDDRHLLLVQDIFYITLMKGIDEEEMVEEEPDDIDIVEFLRQFEREEVASFFSAFDTLANEHRLVPNDNRQVFSLVENRLSFTIGQRYVLNLLPAKQRKGEATYRVIADEPFGVVSKPYDGKPHAMFNRVNSLDLTNAEWGSVHRAVTTELDRTEKSGYLKYNDAAFERLAFDHAFREETLNLAFPQEQVKVMSDSSPKNIILFGPPGTGKTYNSIDKAVSIIDGTSHGHEANKRRYDELVASKQIQFVTFHQSMSYEDFVEGIKPKTDEVTKKVTYAVEPGVFKMICNRAKEAKTGFVNFDKAYNALVKEINSNTDGLTLETQAQNKEFMVTMNSKGNFNVAPKTEKATQMVVRKEWLQTYLTTGEVVDWPSYTKPIAQRLVDVYGLKMTEVQKPKSFVLIIDEINRGNVSQIFGELITLIEQDKREGEKNAISLMLPYSKEPFSVPPNLYIIGTMNTADRSVEALDSALRRRFSFVEMPPKPDLLSPGACFCRLLWDYEKVDWEDKEYKSLETSMLALFGASDELKKKRRVNWDKMLKEGSPKDSQWKLFPDAQFSGINLQKLLNTINNRIEKLLDKDHLIGHSYFIDVRSEADLKSAFRDKIIPLLQEYFFGDYGKIGLVLGKSFIEMDTNSFDGFAEFDYDGGALSDLQERTVFRISAESSWDIPSIVDLK